MLRIPFLAVLIMSSLISKGQLFERPENFEPLFGFIENKGQVVDQDMVPNKNVRYILPLPNNNIIIRSNGFSYDTYVSEQQELPQSDNQKNDVPIFMSAEKPSKEKQLKFHRVDVEFLGCDPGAKIIAMDPASDFMTYYIGPEGRETKVYHYTKLLYKEIYEGIDLEFIANPGKDKQVEYNFIVKPGADASRIRLFYKGALKNELKEGKIELTLSHGKLAESIPASFWRESNKIAEVKYVELEQAGDGIIVGFENAVVKRDETLVIDPTPTLSWGTYFGGTGTEFMTGGAVDASGNYYACGATQSVASVSTAGSHQAVFGGEQDAFLVKFNSSGVRQWATYYGGTAFDVGIRVKVDPGGNVFMIGNTLSTTSISTPGAFQVSGGGPSATDGFLVKFDSNGIRQWATYIGMPGFSEELYGIAFFGNDAIYVNGLTSSPTGLATAGSHQPTYGGDTQDAFFFKFNSSGSRLFSSYYGGPGFESGLQSVCTDQVGNFYIAGTTQSTTMISTAGAHKSTFSGTADAFLAKFDANGVRQWATYYGNESVTGGLSIASDISNNVYMVGPTFSSTSISTAGAHQQAFAGVEDGYLVKFNSAGVRQWGTYYGGSAADDLLSVAVDGSSDVYVTGFTSSTNGIATANAHQTVFAGPGSDALLVKFNSNGVRQWGTYYGGAETDRGNAVAVLASGDAYIFGETLSSTAISTLGSYQQTFGGTQDGFIAKFVVSAACSAPEAAGLAIQNMTQVCAIKFSTDKLNNCLATYAWTFGDGGTSVERNPIHIYASAGTYNVSVQITYNCSGCQNQVTLNKQVTYTVPTSIVETRQIDVTTTTKNDVIQTSASSFSDSWPMNHQNATLNAMNPYLNGTLGVWRNDAAFVYEKDRKLSPTTTLATDGTFPMEMFNWKHADLNAVPNWVKATAMTKYSPFSFDLENQDALGIYTGAIYDYGGRTPVATGANMRNDEMAFTSFEYTPDAGEQIGSDVDGVIAGNWVLKSGTLPAFTYYKVNSGNGNLAIVEASLAQLQNVTTVDVGTPIYWAGFKSKSTYAQNEIICLKAHPQNAAWSVVVLKTAPNDALWIGQLRIKNTVNPTVTAVFDNLGPVHSGRKSLKVAAVTTFRQDVLRLDAGKSYWFNTWVSINNPSAPTPDPRPNLRVEIIAKQQNGTAISTTLCYPEGVVIEGWQQIKKSFIIPANTAYIEVSFVPGDAGSTAWFDDMRLQADNGNMKTYVYDTESLRLVASLDEENFASFFYYDKEGNLYLTKKETTDGIKTITENVTYQLER